MMMKNKLYKHHKGKMHFIFRNLSIAIFSVIGTFMVISLPTYISITANNKTKLEATSEKVDDQTQDSDLLTVEEDNNDNK